MSWALELDPADAGALGPLRLERGLEVHEAVTLWLRGAADPSKRLLTLPAIRRYEVREGRLVPPGARLAVGTLPHGPWLPLQAWLGVELGPAAMAAERPPAVVLRLVPAERSSPIEPSLLCLSRASWRAWGTTASAVRLRPLSFAAAQDGRVLVRGRPLPPLPGQRWIEQGGVAVPCGYAWDPPVDPATCSVALGLLPGDLGLLEPGGTWELLDARRFVAATRASIRSLPDGEPPGA